MTITTLFDLRAYQVETLDRMKKSGRATERQIYMTEYTINVLDDRIEAKYGRQGKNNDAPPVTGGV